MGGVSAIKSGWHSLQYCMPLRLHNHYPAATKQVLATRGVAKPVQCCSSVPGNLIPCDQSTHSLLSVASVVYNDSFEQHINVNYLKLSHSHQPNSTNCCTLSTDTHSSHQLGVLASRGGLCNKQLSDPSYAAVNATYTIVFTHQVVIIGSPLNNWGCSSKNYRQEQVSIRAEEWNE